MKQILSILAVFALVLPLFVANAQEEPQTAKDKKECVSKASKKGCCASKASKAKASSCDGKVKLQKASNKHDGCADKDKEECAKRCADKAKHASAKVKDNGQN